MKSPLNLSENIEQSDSVSKKVVFGNLQISANYLLIPIILLWFMFLVQVSLAQSLTKPNESGPWPSIQVNTYTGNLFYQRKDLFIPTRGEIPLDLYFAYNSLKYEHDKGYGHGWSFSFGMYYKPVGENMVIFREDGQEDVFTWDGAIYLPPPGVFDEFTEYVPGKFLLKTKYGIKYYFDDNAHKHLTSVVDRNNNTITLSYTNGKPSTITDPAGRMIHLVWVDNHLALITDPNTAPNRVFNFLYDGSWNMTSVSGPSGNSWQYTYDANGKMISLTDPRSNSVTVSYDINDAVAGISCASVGYTKTFMYDNCNNTTSVDQIVSLVNRHTVYSFDLSGLVTGIQYPGGSSVSYVWDGQNNLLTYTNELGNNLSLSYDSKGNILNKMDYLGNSESYSYESNYNQLTGYMNKNGDSVYYTYDGLGNRLSTIDCSGQTEFYTYNSNGNITSVTNRRGFITSYEYDLNGKVDKIIWPDSFFDVYTNDVVGNRLTHTDKRGNTTTYTYDLFDRLLSLTDAESGTITYTYDGLGNLLTETNQNSNSTSYSYDALNRLTIITDANSKTTTYTYDQANNLLTQTNPRGCVTAYTYDSRDRKIKMTDALSHEEEYIYDPAGRLISSEDKMGNITTYEYDNEGRVTKITWPDSFFDIYTYLPDGQKSGHTNKNGETTNYSYDCHGSLTNVTYPLGITEAYSYDPVGNLLSHTNKNSFATTYTYDAMDRVVQVTDPLSKSEFYSYDGVGNVVSKTDKNGTITTHAYDMVNRNTSTTYPTGHSEHYGYDGVGNIVQKTDCKGKVTTQTYDKLNRRVSTTSPLGFTESYTYDDIGNQVSFTDKNGNTTLYAHDCLDQLTITTDPLGFTESNSYNARGQRIGFTDKKGNITTWNYGCCRLLSETDPLNFTEYYGYDNNGNRTSVTNKNDYITSYFYDAMDRLFKIITPMGHQTLYTLDGEGNMLSKTDANLHTISYTYNARDEMIQTSYPDGSTVYYTYNNNGDLLQTVNTGGIGETISFTYNAIGKVTSRTTNYGVFTKTITYTLDPNGNVLSTTSQAGTITNTYDDDNRVIQVTDQNGGVTTFQYDGMGNQTAVNSPNGVSTLTTYNGNGHVLSDITQTTPPLLPPPAGADTEAPLAMVGTSNMQLFLNDLAVTGLTEPESGYGLNLEPVTIQITNFGEIPVGAFGVSYEFEGTVFTQWVEMTINPMETVPFTFAQWIDLSAPGSYTLETCVNVPGDENPANNCITSEITNWGTIYQSFNYGYDANGNKILENHLDGTNVQLAYNDRNELISEFTLPLGTLNEYTYLPGGERGSKTSSGIIELYVYDIDGILQTAGGSTFTNDENGNRLTMTNTMGDIISYSYSFENELLAVDLPLGDVEYEYSVLGQMLKKSISGISTYLLFAGNDLLEELNITGSPTCHYNPEFSIFQGGTTGYYYYDGFASTTLQLDPAKLVLASAVYDEFGLNTYLFGAWLNDRKEFEGMLHSPVTGLFFDDESNPSWLQDYDPYTALNLNADPDPKNPKNMDDKVKKNEKDEKKKPQDEKNCRPLCAGKTSGDIEVHRQYERDDEDFSSTLEKKFLRFDFEKEADFFCKAAAFHRLFCHTMRCEKKDQECAVKATVRSYDVSNGPKVEIEDEFHPGKKKKVDVFIAKGKVECECECQDRELWR